MTVRDGTRASARIRAARSNEHLGPDPAFAEAELDEQVDRELAEAIGPQTKYWTSHEPNREPIACSRNVRSNRPSWAVKRVMRLSLNLP